MEVVLTSSSMGSDDLIETLEKQPTWKRDEVTLQLRRSQDFRTPDAVMVVAILSNITTILVALITLIGTLKARRMVIHDKDGRTLEIPAETPHEKVKALLESFGTVTRIHLP
jgi:hypothetical protein